MGQGRETKTKSEPRVDIQERGEIFFFYRPKVEKEEAHGPDDVQRLYIVLRPESGETSTEVKQDPHSGKEGQKKRKAAAASKEDGHPNPPSDSAGGSGTQEVNIEKQPLLRFIVMGRKSLPDPTKKSRPYWGFVEMVTTKPEDIKEALKGEEYDTKTRGHRHNPPARALGEGIYRILRHDSKKKMHTHLVYKLEFPPQDEKNEPQESLNVKREGSYMIQIKNPDQHGGEGGFGGVRSKRKATFPAHLQGRFGKLKYSAADPPDFLNYEGCEFLLISASDDIEEELGLELKTEETGTEEEEESHGGEEEEKSCSDLVKTFGEIGSVTPLFKGTWV